MTTADQAATYLTDFADGNALAVAVHATTASALHNNLIEPTDATRIWWAVLAEHRRAEAKFGVQRLPLGNGTPEDKVAADRARAECDLLYANDSLTHTAIVREEVLETFGAETPGEFVVEAIQAMGTLLDAVMSALEQNPDLTIPPPF